MNDAEIQLVEIWNKWTNYPVPESTLEQLAKECEPIGVMFEELAKMNLESGNVPHNLAGDLAAYARDLGAHFARATFSIGLEYGSKESRKINLDVVSEKAKEALPLFEAESQKITELISQLISGATDSGEIDPSKAEWLATQLGKVQVRSAAKCFQIGMEYSTQV